MDYKEAQAVIPVATLFDLFYAYCEQEPLKKGSSIPRVEILKMVAAAKSMALIIENNSGLPAYDIFAFTVKNIHNVLVEGKGPCAFNRTLCVWKNNGAAILRSLDLKKGNK